MSNILSASRFWFPCRFVGNWPLFNRLEGYDPKNGVSMRSLTVVAFSPNPHYNVSLLQSRRWHTGKRGSRLSCGWEGDSKAEEGRHIKIVHWSTSSSRTEVGLSLIGSFHEEGKERTVFLKHIKGARFECFSASDDNLEAPQWRAPFRRCQSAEIPSALEYFRSSHHPGLSFHRQTHT